MALSVCYALLKLVSQRCWVGRRGNNFPIIVVITPGSYHHGCLSKKSCITTVPVRMRMVSLFRMMMSWTALLSEGFQSELHVNFTFSRRQPFNVHHAAL